MLCSFVTGNVRSSEAFVSDFEAKVDKEMGSKGILCLYTNIIVCFVVSGVLELGHVYFFMSHVLMYWCLPRV